MSEFDDYGVPTRNRHDCERSAATLRQLLDVSPGPLPNIMEVLDRARSRIPEAKNVEILPRPDEVMGRAYAFANGADIVARQSIVEGAIDDTPLSRYVLCHELVHVIFHPGPKKFRMAGGNEEFRFLAKETSAEWQADYIARAMFMPPEMVGGAANPQRLAALARVPLAEAIARSELFRVNAAAPAVDSDFFTPPTSGRSNKSPLGELKARVWAQLPIIPGEDPAENRLSGLYRIKWSEFGLTSQCGWYLERGNIVAFFSKRQGT